MNCSCCGCGCGIGLVAVAVTAFGVWKLVARLGVSVST